MMRVLAVTGGIGSGKSLVCAMLGKRGVAVYDSDSRTKALYQDNRLVDSLELALGLSLRNESGQLDRGLLARKIFSDASALASLEAIVHPLVLEDFLKWKAVQNGTEYDFVVIESAVILEKEIFREVIDDILLVDAPMVLRLRRAAERDKLSEAELGDRISRQALLNDISNGYKHPDVDYLIENVGSIAELELKLNEFLLKYNIVK